MFSVFDIFRKNRQQKSTAFDSEQDAGSALCSSPEGSVAGPPRGSNDMRIGPALKREETEELIKQVTGLHKEVVDLAGNVYASEAAALAQLRPAIASLCERLVDEPAVSCRACLRVCLADYPEGALYLYGHVANVCFMSLQLARGLGFERSRLLETAEAAFMHDIGMVGFLGLANKPMRFIGQEIEEIKKHPQHGLNLINQANAGFPAMVFDVVGQEHERMDGSGYPQGLKDAEISEAAQVIGLVDVYEAMLHARPYRKKLTPSEAMNTILENKKAFGYPVVKILIEKIGIFPVGSLVRLNTREIAQVVRDNMQSPLRPVVSVVCSSEGKQLKDPKQVDLMGNPLIYIEECLDCPLPQGV